MIKFECPGCASVFTVEDAKAGKSGKCPKCQTQFIIPESAGGGGSSAFSSLPSVSIPDPNAPIEIDPCPRCQTKLSVAVGDLGSDVECPTCQTVFKASKPGMRPPAPPPIPSRKSSAETKSSASSSKSKFDDDDDDDRPRKRKRDDDDRPSNTKSKSRSSRDDDDDDEDDRPRKTRRTNRRRSAQGTVFLKRLGVVSFGKMIGATYALGALIMMLPIFLISLTIGGAAGNAGNPGAGGGLVLFSGFYLLMLPVYSGVGGFIGGCITALIYNIVAGFAGGIEMELDDY